MPHSVVTLRGLSFSERKQMRSKSEGGEGGLGGVEGGETVIKIDKVREKVYFQ